LSGLLSPGRVIGYLGLNALLLGLLRSPGGCRSCDLRVIPLPRSAELDLEDRRMHVIHRRGWEIPERHATPEHLFVDRRAFLAAAAMAVGGAAAALSTTPAAAQRAGDVPDPTIDLYPAKRNEKYVLDRPITDEKLNINYNNFYEFGTSKQIASAAQALKPRPWTVKIDGMVEKQQELGIDDLIRKMPLEERLYRHRCVEAWGMAIPWSGFPLAKLVELAKPLGSAKFLKMETFKDSAMAPGQRGLNSFWPWPYVEGLTMAEATNELAFMVTGAYGKPVAKSQGAPLRLAVPWKYGFKSIKSITRFTFTDQRPKTFWEISGPSEYGFWANVNPDVPHPRWSQARETSIGVVGERRPTLLFNGYGEYVAGLYKGLEKEPLWM
jgi:sulfoxide reductase catalytic subunit YedY